MFTFFSKGNIKMNKANSNTNMINIYVIKLLQEGNFLSHNFQANH